MIADLAEARQFTPEDLLDMTLPQLHSVFAGNQKEETREFSTGAAQVRAVAALEQAERDREEEILAALERGEIA